jgi:hypothetical protein
MSVFHNNDLQLDAQFNSESKLKANFVASVNINKIEGVGEEIDPTVPDWAKQPEKPVYTTKEIEGSVGEDVSGTVQTPYDVDPKSLEYTWLEPITAAEGAEIFNCYDGDRDELGIPGVDRNIATGFMSQATGFRTQARGNYSQASGWWTIAEGQCSHAEGLLSKTLGHFCHAEGTRTQATVNNAHSEGDSTKATGRQGHSEGASTTSSGQNSHAEGYLSVSSGIASHAEGWGTLAKGQSQTAMGKFNIGDTSNRLIVGIGTSDTARSNGFTVSSKGAGWFASTVTSTGADYAELFEWLDGNPDDEDRIGLLVTLDGEKIRLANEGDDVIGAISGTAMVLGDNAAYEWKDKYVTDNYGRIVYGEPVEEFVEYTDTVDPEDASTWVVRKESAGFHTYPKINPNFDASQEYIGREHRKEWDAVGMLGKLYVNDDGSCAVGGYVTVGNNGIATASDTKTNMRVMKRLADNVILVLMR